MEEGKTLLSAVPTRGAITILGPEGELIAMQVGPAVKPGESLASEVIRILNGKYDTSQISVETLGDFAELISWEGDKIEVKWKA